MVDPDLERQIAFLTEIDKLKSVQRASPLIDRSRRENSAEHSWHLAMYALVLEQHSDVSVDLARVIQMLLIHDIVEIDAGDHPLYGAHPPEEQADAEERAAIRLFGLLPERQGAAMLDLWREFEGGASNDARFAKSLDRFQPVIQNVETDGGTLREYDVPEDKALNTYGPPIEDGSVNLWDYARSRIADYFAGSKHPAADG